MKYNRESVIILRSGLTYSLAASAAGITYKTLNDWLNRGRQRNLGNIFSFIDTFKNAMLKELRNFLRI
jgi:hypothetical protein